MKFAILVLCPTLFSVFIYIDIERHYWRVIMNQEKIGSFLSSVRKEKGLTQEQLGEKLGVTQKTISRWETGKNMPDISMFSDICDTLDIEITELFKGERISSEYVTKSDTSKIIRDLIVIVMQKNHILKIVGAILSIVITITCMIGLYNYEFSISVDSTTDLEAAINTYHFNEELLSNVLEHTAIGNKLFVLYEQKNHTSAGGLACMEKGIFGKYRMVSCNDINYPLIYTIKTAADGNNYAISFCVNDLPEVKSYAIYGTDNSSHNQNITNDDMNDLIYSNDYDGSPFLHIREIESDIKINPYKAKYYGERGAEINSTTLYELFNIDENACNSSYGSADLSKLYCLEGIIFILGIVFLRYFFTKSS